MFTRIIWHCCTAYIHYTRIPLTQHLSLITLPGEFCTIKCVTHMYLKIKYICSSIISYVWYVHYAQTKIELFKIPNIKCILNKFILFYLNSFFYLFAENILTFFFMDRYVHNISLKVCNMTLPMPMYAIP